MDAYGALVARARTDSLNPLLLVNGTSAAASSAFWGLSTVWAVRRLHAPAGALGVTLLIEALAAAGAAYAAGRLSEVRR